MTYQILWRGEMATGGRAPVPFKAAIVRFMDGRLVILDMGGPLPREIHKTMVRAESYMSVIDTLLKEANSQ